MTKKLNAPKTLILNMMYSFRNYIVHKYYTAYSYIPMISIKTKLTRKTHFFVKLI